jgi:hypothetical protein
LSAFIKKGEPVWKTDTALASHEMGLDIDMPEIDMSETA